MDELEFYDGRYTGQEIDDAIGFTRAWQEDGVLTVAVTALSALPATVSDDMIISDHVVVDAVLSNPAAQIRDWEVTTADGSLTISGAINGTTNLTLTLVRVSASI